MINEEFVRAVLNTKNPVKLVKFATIEPAYKSGRPRLIFDGEATPTGKAYVYLSSYTPTAGDRVMVVHGAVIGKLV